MNNLGGRNVPDNSGNKLDRIFVEEAIRNYLTRSQWSLHEDEGLENVSEIVQLVNRIRFNQLQVIKDFIKAYINNYGLKVGDFSFLKGLFSELNILFFPVREIIENPGCDLVFKTQDEINKCIEEGHDPTTYFLSISNDCFSRCTYDKRAFKRSLEQLIKGIETFLAKNHHIEYFPPSKYNLELINEMSLCSVETYNKWLDGLIDLFRLLIDHFEDWLQEDDEGEVCKAPTFNGKYRNDLYAN